MYYHRNWNINLYNPEVGLMKKFLKENWQYLVATGAAVGAGLGLTITIINLIATAIMNALLWILEQLVTRL